LTNAPLISVASTGFFRKRIAKIKVRGKTAKFFASFLSTVVKPPAGGLFIVTGMPARRPYTLLGASLCPTPIRPKQGLESKIIRRSLKLIAKILQSRNRAK